MAQFVEGVEPDLDNAGLVLQDLLRGADALREVLAVLSLLGFVQKLGDLLELLVQRITVL